MYAMRAMASTEFFLMMLPHDGKIVMVDQLNYHDPQRPMAPTNVIPTINTIVDSTITPPLLATGPGLFIDMNMTTSFLLLPPSPTLSGTVDLFML